EGTRENRSAIGARIAVYLETPRGPRAIHRVISTGGSFGSSTLQEEIGLGDAVSVSRLEVTWPASGVTPTFRGLALDTHYPLREGAAPVVSPARRIQLGSPRG